MKRVAVLASSTQNGLRGPRLCACQVLEDLAQVEHLAVEGLGEACLAAEGLASDGRDQLRGVCCFRQLGRRGEGNESETENDEFLNAR